MDTVGSLVEGAGTRAQANQISLNICRFVEVRTTSYRLDLEQNERGRGYLCRGDPDDARK